ncbi:TetR/AcrR family transcriptional regulator [Nocardioides sp. KC13]|uniref:TetR/AcrR family transcriptional regulator n=1 Tax=Nocardioides turkmenicus TaxID=2711220 RepID=A0A6M1R729_9ACTN|nr:TetR/AcrR family transcriptional regulator [Nocardioides sp. KC13]NGN94491.1 TetR/AcrR family transcriptional regulator [Nocardioides sp. KC13]
MTSRPVGRPRAFDRDDALLAAARLFWSRGYSGTTTRALSSALGMSTSSMYAAFGSKAGLFEEAVRTYAERYRTIYIEACAEPELGDVLGQLLRRSVEEFTQPSAHHPGCLISSAAMTDTPDTIDIRAYASELHASNERLLRERIEQERDESRLRIDIAPSTLAALVQTLWHGLSTQSNQGVGRDRLLEIVEAALATLLVHERLGG